jgi:hypothetical protein
MLKLPQPGQKVCWRDLHRARARGWEAFFSSGPFEVVRIVDKRAKGLAAGVVLRTLVGEREISEIWLALANKPDGDSS